MLPLLMIEQEIDGQEYKLLDKEPFVLPYLIVVLN